MNEQKDKKQTPESVRDGRKFMVNADRSSAFRRVRYVEGSMPEKENCKVCQVHS